MLATSSKKRFKALPDISSAAEQGITNSDLIGWWSVHAPKGTPKPVLDRLEKEFNEIAVSDEHVKFLLNLGSDPLGVERLRQARQDRTTELISGAFVIRGGRPPAVCV